MFSYNFYKINVSNENTEKTIIAKMREDVAGEIVSFLLNKDGKAQLSTTDFTDIEANKWLYSQIKNLKELNLHTSSLDEVYEMLFEMSLTYNSIETRETLIDYVIDNIKKGFKVAPLLESLEDNPGTDYFEFDLTGWSNNSAEPIYSIEEMIEACL